MNDTIAYDAARQLIDQYGADAATQAADKVDAMLRRGDLAGVTMWKRILKAITEIQTTKGQTKH